MASETDIKRMLIDALRPSLAEVISQEMTPWAEVRADFASGEAALKQRIDELTHRTSGDIAALGDAQQDLDQRVKVTLANFVSQLALLKTDLDAQRDAMKQSLERLAGCVERFEQRLSAAGAELREELLRLHSEHGSHPDQHQKQAAE